MKRPKAALAVLGALAGMALGCNSGGSGNPTPGPKREAPVVPTMTALRSSPGEDDARITKCEARSATTVQVDIQFGDTDVKTHKMIATVSVTSQSGGTVTKDISSAARISPGQYLDAVGNEIEMKSATGPVCVITSVRYD